MSTIPGVMPEEAVAEYAKLHSSPWVSGWVIVQSLCMLPLGLAMLAAGIGLWRRGTWAVALTRRCALTILALGVLGQLVLSVHLYPDLRGGALGIEGGEEFFAIMILAAVAGMIWPAIAAGATLRRGRG